jgi:hypothetical protein
MSQLPQKRSSLPRHTMPSIRLFRPCPSCKARKQKDKSSGLDPPATGEPLKTTANARAGPSNKTLEEILDPDGDLYDPPPLLPNATGPQIRLALHSRAIAAICNYQAMEIDKGGPRTHPANEYNPILFPKALNVNTSKPPEVISDTAQTDSYSPSRPHPGAAKQSFI